MSWLRSSPLRQSFNRGRSQANQLTDFDEKAVIDSFCQHWQQAHGIINRSEVRKYYIFLHYFLSLEITTLSFIFACLLCTVKKNHSEIGSISIWFQLVFWKQFFMMITHSFCGFCLWDFGVSDGSQDSLEMILIMSIILISGIFWNLCVYLFEVTFSTFPTSPSPKISNNSKTTI